MPPNSAHAAVDSDFANLATKEARHFIFGYGSLLCPQSRAITAPTVAGQPSHPVTVHHLERTWTARSGTGTYVAVSFQENSKCSGVLIEVDDDELKQFDIREVGYDRAQVKLSHIDLFPSEHDANLDDTEKDVNVWVYVSNNPQPANPAYPILQSYVDIILRGCLHISEDFARSFIQTTQGWWHIDKHDFGAEDEEKKKEDNDESHYTWIDDRHSPKYVRADDDFHVRTDIILMPSYELIKLKHFINVGEYK
eukprot:CAMPEP_0195293222 /NCGR_PEP_ID=MMETSP0707-20130614/12005_1 /TAXON_ID=33640 /ORGANISM="Asterionellopsis glacialis, Strain CCMP134" /LENGTH=251 /DNA_ID=CAMNT_0040353887 /DNA_START=130 /DNA_END=883 /DNA_ORIENTATION=+